MQTSGHTRPATASVLWATGVTDSAVPWILRTGVAMCYIGHGVFGIITKSAWVPYFAVVGINETWAWRLMPWVGTMDVAVGFLVLIWPCRALFVWATFWAAWTALLRPLAGQGWPEFFERAGNYGVSLAILMVIGVNGPWLSRVQDWWPKLNANIRKRLERLLRAATAVLLAGHAGYAVLLKKAALASHYEVLAGERAGQLMLGIGYFEYVLAMLVLVVPSPAVFVGVAAWKLLSESLFLTSGVTVPVFEIIERGGSYAVPLACAFLMLQARPPPNTDHI